VHNPSDNKYYIQSQNDLYQVDEFIKFVMPPGWILVWAWQFWSTFFCLLGAAMLWPITLIEQFIWHEKQSKKNQTQRERGLPDGIELRDLERKSLVNG